MNVKNDYPSIFLSKKDPSYETMKDIVKGICKAYNIPIKESEQQIGQPMEKGFIIDYEGTLITFYEIEKE